MILVLILVKNDGGEDFIINIDGINRAGGMNSGEAGPSNFGCHAT